MGPVGTACPGATGGATLAGDDTEMDISLARKRTGWSRGDLEGSEEMGGTVSGLMAMKRFDSCGDGQPRLEQHETFQPGRMTRHLTYNAYV